LVPRLDKFEGQGQRSKVKITRDKKLTFFDPFGGLRAVYIMFLVSGFCLCMKYLRKRWTDLRQIHMEDAFGPSLGPCLVRPI